MKAATEPRLPSRPLALPNLLTYGRIAAVPAVVAAMYWQDIWQGGLWLRWVAMTIFIVAALTDILKTALAHPLCVGMQVTIFDPDLDPDGTYARDITTMLVKAFD